METTKLMIQTGTSRFCVDVLAGKEFEEEILMVLDRYTDRIHESWVQ